jgi:hypothetical protein
MERCVNDSITVCSLQGRMNVPNSRRHELLAAHRIEDRGASGYSDTHY